MSYAEEMKESFKEARSRIYRAGLIHQQSKPPQKTEKELVAESVDRWRQKDAEARKAAIERRRERLVAKIDIRMGTEPVEPRRPTVAEILDDVALKHNVSVLDIKSHRRTQPIILARHEAMWRACMETNLSLPVIGRIIGGRDHTTIIHGRNQHAKRIANGTAMGEAK